MYKIRFPVGDWSGDGHTQCEWYIVESNKPLDDVRKAHFDATEKLGIDIGSICRNYEEDLLPKDIEEKLAKLNCGVINDIRKSYGKELSEEAIRLEPDDMIEIWLFILMKAGDNLELKIIEDDIPSIAYYGSEDGKHLNTPGYGLFYP